MRAPTSAIAAALILAALTGCASLVPTPMTHGASSSLVAFLYPDGNVPPKDNSIPELRVPLRVGLAFLPARPGASGPDEVQKAQLLERVRAHFSDRKFVSEIVVIPDYYLPSAGGFQGLAGVQRLYSLDVVALVSYDQLTHGDANAWSLGYWSIVGAYVLKGDRYDVTTLVDLAVVDPTTRSLILRAGGVDTRHGNATLIAAPREQRDAAAASFSGAGGEMITHLDTALSEFESQVRAGHANVRVVGRDGHGGGGALDPYGVLVLLLVLAWRMHTATPRRCQ